MLVSQLQSMESYSNQSRSNNDRPLSPVGQGEMKLPGQLHVWGIFDKKGQLKTPHKLPDYKDNSGSILFLSFKK